MEFTDLFTREKKWQWALFLTYDLGPVDFLETEILPKIRVSENFTIAIDDGLTVGKYGPISAIPVTVLIDKDFTIAKKYVGARPKKVFVTDIINLLL